jgi:hypothetical protein
MLMSDLLSHVSVQINGRTIYPELQHTFEQYAKELSLMMSGIESISEAFPFELEPAPVFYPEK